MNLASASVPDGRYTARHECRCSGSGHGRSPATNRSACERSLCSRQSTHHPTIALSHIGARCRYGIQVRGEALTNTVPESNWRSTPGRALPIKSYTVRYGTMTGFEPTPSLPVNLYSLSKSVGRRWVLRTLKTNRSSANSSYPLMISGRRYGVPRLPHLFGLSHANACTSNDLKHCSWG